MKIRMQGDAVRYRLNRREVEEFARTGRIETAVHFSTGVLRYALESDAELRSVEASYAPGLILIRLPTNRAREWASGDEVSVTGKHAASGRELEIVIEKDFQCLHKGEGGKDPDAYPNPAAGSGSPG